MPGDERFGLARDRSGDAQRKRIAGGRAAEMKKKNDGNKNLGPTKKKKPNKKEREKGTGGPAVTSVKLS